MCTTIVSCYSDEVDSITVYNNPFSPVSHISKHKILICGDKIDKYGNNKFCLPNSSSRNGKYQANFLLENWLKRLNSKFQNRDRELLTYTHPNASKA